MTYIIKLNWESIFFAKVIGSLQFMEDRSISVCHFLTSYILFGLSSIGEECGKNQNYNCKFLSNARKWLLTESTCSCQFAILVFHDKLSYLDCPSIGQVCERQIVVFHMMLKGEG